MSENCKERCWYLECILIQGGKIQVTGIEKDLRYWQEKWVGGDNGILNYQCPFELDYYRTYWIPMKHIIAMSLFTNQTSGV